MASGDASEHMLVEDVETQSVLKRLRSKRGAVEALVDDAIDDFERLRQLYPLGRWRTYRTVLVDGFWRRVADSVTLHFALNVIVMVSGTCTFFFFLLHYKPVGPSLDLGEGRSSPPPTVAIPNRNEEHL